MFDEKKKRYLWEVTWKGTRKFQRDVFRLLCHFVLKNPGYSEATLMEHLKKRGKYFYEDEHLVIKRIPFVPIGPPGERLNVPDRLFWEIDIPGTNWNMAYYFAIERVLARGNEEDFKELVRFYGLETVLNVFRNDATFWPLEMEERAQKYFGLEDRDLKIYYLRLSLPAGCVGYNC